MATENKFYNNFYAKGGWGYDRAKELNFIRKYITKEWSLGARVVEIGAGTCIHSDILQSLGFRVTAVEASKSGVAQANKRFPKLDVVLADVSSWEPSFEIDHIFARGMSFYHYELNSVNSHGIDVPRYTKRFMSWLKKGGTFTLQIVTDFSGRRPERRVHMNRLSDYINLFKPLGKVVRVTDWKGRSLLGKQTPKPAWKPDRGIIIETKKV